MRAIKFSKIMAATGLAMAAIAFGAPASHAFGGPSGPLAWLVGRGEAFTCSARAERKLPLTAKARYLIRLRNEEPVEEIARIFIKPDGTFQGTAFFASNDACTLDVANGRLVLDSKGVGTANLDLVAGSKVSDIKKLPCMALLGGRRSVSHSFKAALASESRLAGNLRIEMIGEVDFTHAGGVNAGVPVKVECEKQSDSVANRP